MINKICEVCKSTFSIHRYRILSAKTCGDKCRSDRHSKVLRNSGEGWVNKNGYRYVMQDRKMVLEHRLVVEKYYSIKLKRSQAVHHKNHQRTDNRIENLEIMDRSTHARMHIMENRPWQYQNAL